MNNVRIAIRDSTDSHNVAFFDNISGIRYRSANMQRFLAGSASILTIEYNSKDIDTIRTGCKLAFIYKDRPYWLNIMNLSKKGYKVEIMAYSLGLELNQEERGAHKPDNAMSFAEYLAYYDPEHALELGVNEVADKRIKLEWTGTDTILARLFSIANSFDAELEFTVELNQDYSLKRQVLNIYKKGNLGSNRAASPIRVGRGLKVINYSDNLKELRTAVRATGKDGLTIDGLNKKVYDDDGNLLYYSSGMTVYAPQSRDKYPSVGKKSNDNWIIKELGETEYSTKEALWGYMLGELKKICLPEITYDIEGAINGDVGDTRTLIDDVHYDPPLYVQARISELTEDLITGRVTKSTLTNFERKYSQVASELLKQVEQLANEAAPYIIRLETNNGFNFKNGKGSSTVTASLEKYGKIVGASWQWIINNSLFSDKQSVTINASQVTGTLNVVAVASVDGNEVAREYITFTNSDDGVGIKSIKRYYTTNDQTEGVTAGGQNWSTKPTTVTADKNYMWSYDVITYTNDTSLVTEPAVIGARGDDGLDADTTGITEALDKAKQELTALSANIEKVRDDSLAAVEEAKQQLATVANDLSAAKQDLQTQASQLQAQASAQSELTKRVSTVEETANGTKTTVSELSKTVAQNGKDITSVTARTKTVEDDLTSTKTTLSQVQTTANSASQKTATLETGLDGVKADLAVTTATADTTKTNLANYQASNDKAVANLQSNIQTANGNISSLQTKVEAVPGQITSAVSAVEGKIPTSAGGRNLALGTSDEWSNPYTWFNGDVNNVIYIAKVLTSGLKVGDTLKAYVEVKYKNIVPAEGKTAKIWTQDSGNVTEWNNGGFSFSEPKTLSGSGEIIFEITDTMHSDHLKNTYWNWSFRTDYVASGSIQFRLAKVEAGDLSTPWSPAPEDTVSQISSLSSQIKQTADGMTLLATKTELNSAKTELQSGITTATNKANTAQSTADSAVTKANAAQSTANSNAQTISTHTTQISALNTGLSAKVSQTDFNTLSGRVTTAENNITAKANELSSKITSVEGKIPTSAGGRNLALGTSDEWSNPYTWFNGDVNNVIYIAKVLTSGLKVGDTLKAYVEVKYKNIVPAEGKTAKIWTQDSGNVTEWNNGGFSFSEPKTLSGSGEIIFEITDTMHSDHLKNTYWNWSFRTDYVASGSIQFRLAKVEAGDLSTPWSPAPEDYDSKLAAAQSEIKQTTDAITASVSSVQTAASNAQSTANTAVSKADAAQAGINTLDNTTVKTATLNLDNNGFVTKVGKTVNGNTFATMIAQNESDVQIIAKKMKVSGDMIVNGAITAEKLNINSLSAVNSNLGKIEGGSLLLQENKAASSSIDNWGTFNRPAHKQGLYMDNRGLASSGAIQRKNGGETTPTDMPLAVLQSGELRFLVVDYNDNLEDVLHHGLSDPDFGVIRFEIDSELKRRLTMTSSGYLNFQATNYTNWTPTGVSGCEYMIQGRLVLVNYDVTFNSAGTHTIGGIPQEFTKKSLMMTAKAWTITPRDKNIQLNSDGTLHILDAEANVNYRGTLVFSY
ncbi:Chromosome partition protein Smc [Streptococcus infantarius subsp. infantarius]|nr:Chromosome partition protein Smc [Streptococcus infantarius subsp. infantarius]